MPFVVSSLIASHPKAPHTCNIIMKMENDIHLAGYGEMRVALCHGTNDKFIFVYFTLK
jgi:hypothetical protein